MSKFQELLSVKDFIHRLNENTSAPIGKNMVYAMMQEPGFPSIKIGKRWFVLSDKVNDWFSIQASNNVKGHVENVDEQSSDANIRLTH